MSAPTPTLPTPSSEIRFLVEGPDDSGVLIGLLKYHGYEDYLDRHSGPILVQEVKGVNALPKEFQVVLKGSKTSHIGIVVDADNDPKARWASLRAMLNTAGYTSPPAACPSNGAVVVEAGKIPVGVWIMPNNRDPGTIEHFVGGLIPSGNVLWPHAKRVVTGLSRASKLVGPPNIVIKAQIHTWLAWQREPGQPMGLAITKRFLDPNAQPCKDIGDWIQRLFSA